MPNPEKPEEVIQRVLYINQDEILLAFRPPLEKKATMMLGPSDKGAQININNPDVLTLPKFQLADGGTAWVGKPLFWHEHQMGMYVIAFEAANQIVVKATREEMEALGSVESGGNIIV